MKGFEWIPMASKRQSAGLLMYERGDDGKLWLLIAHPGGPIFHGKDAGHWGIPKGEFEEGETAMAAAVREFEEETGLLCSSDTEWIELGVIVQRGGKRVHAWAFAGRLAADYQLCCNTIELEWPVGSGKVYVIPEIDEVRMVDVLEARRLMRPEQFELVERLIAHLESPQKLDPV